MARQAVEREMSHEPGSRQQETHGPRPTLALKQFQTTQTSPFWPMEKLTSLNTTQQTDLAVSMS